MAWWGGSVVLWWSLVVLRWGLVVLWQGFCGELVLPCVVLVRDEAL